MPKTIVHDVVIHGRHACPRIQAEFKGKGVSILHIHEYPPRKNSNFVEIPWDEISSCDFTGKVVWVKTRTPAVLGGSMCGRIDFAFPHTGKRGKAPMKPFPFFVAFCVFETLLAIAYF